MKEEQDKIVSRILEDSEKLIIPDKLNPERIAGILERRKAGKRRRLWCSMAAAACTVLFLCVSLSAYNMAQEFKMKDISGSGMQSSDVPARTDHMDSVKETMHKEEEPGREIPPDQLTPAKSYSEIYAYLEKQEQSWKKYEQIRKSEMNVSASLNTDSMPDTGSTRYSGTNIQVEGIDEGDIVKTDGQYIYYLEQDEQMSSSRLKIVMAGKDSMNTVSELSVEGYGKELYIDGDRLVVISEQQIQTEQDGSMGVKAPVYDACVDVLCLPYGFWSCRTEVLVYDISDRKAPVVVNTLVQDGSYRSSRRKGHYLYLFSNYGVSVPSEEEQKEKYIPKVNGCLLTADKIYLPEEGGSEYLVMAAFDLTDGAGYTDSRAVMMHGDYFYVSDEHIYIVDSGWMNWNDNTGTARILRYGYNDGNIASEAEGEVKGFVDSSFSMDEKDGLLRMVTTVQEPDSGDWAGNNLYILDEEMKVRSSIENLAKGERIYAARFLGDYAYFVTFRQTDPLFSADLSDTYHPKIAGELKLTGFSDYLHYYGNNRLFGIGKEVDPENGEILGIKLSMYDISDPSCVTEIHKLVLDHAQWSAALDNPKAVLIQPEKKLIGFPVEGCTGGNYNYIQQYAAFSYDEEKGFINRYNIPVTEGAYSDRTRGLYINDTLYITGNLGIEAYDLDTGERKGTVR